MILGPAQSGQSEYHVSFHPRILVQESEWCTLGDSWDPWDNQLLPEGRGARQPTVPILSAPIIRPLRDSNKS